MPILEGSQIKLLPGYVNSIARWLRVNGKDFLLPGLSAYAKNANVRRQPDQAVAAVCELNNSLTKGKRQRLASAGFIRICEKCQF